MSRIYFHSPSDEAEVRGSERAHAGIVVSDIFAMALQLSGHMDVDTFAAWKSLLPQPNYLFLVGRENYAAGLRTWLSVGDESLFIKWRTP